MSGKIAITTGQAFTDIDSLACAVAYQELLVLEGEQATAVLPGVLNASVTSTVRQWGWQIATEAKETYDKVVVVDLSNPENFATFVDLEKVVEIFDHHVGFEDYWQERLGSQARIEFIGACATLIWEEYKKRSLQDRISQSSARLLLSAIVANTLNFQISATDKQDHLAYKELFPLANLPVSWPADYFQEQEQAVYQDITRALINDTKPLSLWNRAVAFGQVELWDGKDFLQDHLSKVRQALGSFSAGTLVMNVASIHDGRSYFYVEDRGIQKFFFNKIGAHFEGSFGSAPRLWLRKEIIKAARE